MARYIDADAMIEDLKNQMKTATNPFFAMSCDFCIFNLEGQPTAYDVEAVVVELEEMKCYESGCLGVSCDKCKYNESCLEGEEAFKVALDNAIEVVRNGGKE